MRDRLRSAGQPLEGCGGGDVLVCARPDVERAVAVEQDRARAYTCQGRDSINRALK